MSWVGGTGNENGDRGICLESEGERRRAEIEIYVVSGNEKGRERKQKYLWSEGRGKRE